MREAESTAACEGTVQAVGDSVNNVMKLTQPGGATSLSRLERQEGSAKHFKTNHTAKRAARPCIGLSAIVLGATILETRWRTLRIDPLLLQSACLFKSTFAPGA